MSVVRTRNDCRLCHSSHLVRRVELAPVPVLTVNNAGHECPPNMEMAPLNLCQCKACGHLQLSEWIDAELQYRNFNYRTALSTGLVEHFTSLSNEVFQRIVGNSDSFVIDIGSNDGTLLRPFKDRGVRVLGIEPGFSIAQEAQQAGIPTLPQFFDRKLADLIVTQHGQADAILCCNTMANLNDLDDFAEGIVALLKPSGLFVFETQWGADVVDKTLIDTIYHEHQSYFLIEPLREFFHKHGLELVSVEGLPTKGGSIRGYVRHTKRALVDRSVLNFVEREQEMDLGSPLVYDELNRRIERMREFVFQSLPGGQYTAAGFGVSVGSSTLLAQLELEHTLEYLVDDNPQIRKLPGEYHDLPVYNSEFLYEDKPDRVLILAWRYADQIMKKHQRFIDEGGEFIVPWPKFKIVGKANGVAN